MNKTPGRKATLLLGLLLLAAFSASDASDAPPDVASKLVIQLVTFEKTLMSTEGEMTIHVVGSAELASALKNSVGWQLGKRKLSKVTSSNALPTEAPDVLFLCDKNKLSEVIEYTRKEQIFSMTNIPKLVKKGVSLGIGVGGKGQPTVTLNLSASKAEGLDWNPAILKIAKTVK
jgi:hypothetical protein